MPEYSEILDSVGRNSPTLKESLKKLRLNIIVVPVFFTLAYLIVRITNVFEWDNGIGLVTGFWIGTLLRVVFRETDAIYIYGYSVNDETVKLLLVNIFGKRKELIVPVKQIEKVKFRKKNFWRSYDKVWIHLTDPGPYKELYFLKSGAGDKLTEDMNVKII